MLVILIGSVAVLVARAHVPELETIAGLNGGAL
jgi:hypothetical protein